MNDLQTLPLSALSAYPAGTAPNLARSPAIEEVVVKGDKQEEEGFTFFDFLDVINPLQHIPVVNTIYREMTGDEIKAPAKMIGSAILGGPVGLAVAMVDTIIEDSTGKDMGGHAMSMFKGEDPTNSETVLAASSTSSASVSNASVSSAAVTPAAVTMDAPQTLTAAFASTAQAVASQTTLAREFVPALSLETASERSAPGAVASWASLIEDGTKDPVQQEADARTQETQASIAAASAAAPQGLVFMPLPGRQGAAFKPAAPGETGNRFMPVDGLARTSQAPADPTRVAQLQARTAFPPGTVGVNGLSGVTNSDQLNAMLEATKPRGDTGRMPTADPFAAARMLGEENAPTVMPAWFEAATSGAIDKYKAMQATP